MAESQGGAPLRPTPTTYTAQPDPYLRNKTSKDEWRSAKQNNRMMAGKLSELKKEPPATFHAPQGYASLRQGSQLKTQRHGKEQSHMPATHHHVDVPPWPPTRLDNARQDHVKQDQQIAVGNANLAKKLVDLYTSVRPRTATNQGGVYREEGYKAPNCLAMWAQRTAQYIPNRPPEDSPFSARYTPPNYSPLVTQARLAGAATEATMQQPPQQSPQSESEQQQQGQGQGHGQQQSSQPQQQQQASQSQQQQGQGQGQGQQQSSQPQQQQQQQQSQSQQLVTQRPHSTSPFGQTPRASRARVRSASSRVPSSLGLAVCAGCNARGFHKADGVYLEQCKHCGQVWYCSELCAQVDWVNHKAICKWATTGQWAPFGKKPVEEHWVVNSSLAAGMAELRRRAKQAQAERFTQGSTAALIRELESGARGGRPSYDPVPSNTGPSSDTMGHKMKYHDTDKMHQSLEAAEAVKAVMARAKAKDKEMERRQKEVEKAAFHGLDGPRPCMFMGGKPI